MARKPKSPAPGFAEERQASLDVGAQAPGGKPAPESEAERRLLKIGPDGRVLIPADWRQAMQLVDNDTLVAHLENGELRLHGSAVGLRKAREILRRFVRPGVSMVDELLEDRRREVRREAEEDEEWAKRR